MANGLGRGLNSLIPNKQNQADDPPPRGTSDADPQASGGSADGDNERIYSIPLDKIDVNPLQPRHRFVDARLEELEKSIRDHGIIQPLIVTRKVGGRYELIAGERRLRASKKVELKEVPVIVRDADREDKLEVALIENIQREDLSPIDLGLAYRKMMDEFGYSQEQVADKVGKSRSAVANTLRYLGLPEEIKLALIDGKITEGHAKYLIGLDTEKKQMSLFRKILHNKLTVSDTGTETRRMGGTKAARTPVNYHDKDKEFLFREFFGARTEVKRKGKGGQIIIHFYSEDELLEIVDKIKK